jgi:hypothetical protein
MILGGVSKRCASVKPLLADAYDRLWFRDEAGHLDLMAKTSDVPTTRRASTPPPPLGASSIERLARTRSGKEIWGFSRFVRTGKSPRRG